MLMLWCMVIVLILFNLYIIYSLSTIKYELQLICKHLHILDDEDKEKISNEEIENELEDKLNI
ncbi:hypothetical protein GMD78_05750 [Ornithinibacillus sp. L9]|uniref:Uncharacterized protein n=1 Tax=Ornithinibacillus caprae TaxID=2678566 RepID=A0A6N8FE06_9BACI|nr:hypothetical protein [Ornithinibacillus caprae]MUK87902.1 hypothetical protein [Ornithinibacillus caprae]